MIAGDAWFEEFVITLSLSTGVEKGCLAVQSRFSGLGHEDGLDLLSRSSIELLRSKVDPDSKAFKRYRDCIKR